MGDNLRAGSGGPPAPPLSHKELQKVLSGGNDSSAKNLAPRKERSKSRDLGKKMGGGQKGVWENNTEILTAPAVDNGDPNFDSEGDDNVVLVPDAVVPRPAYRKSSFDYGPKPKLHLPEMKKAIVTILREFFVSGDFEEVERSIGELQSEVFHYEIVKRAISMSMDKHEKEREMVSKLLSHLYPKILSTIQVGKGFERVMEYADDLELDTPNAREIVAMFLARAVVDEILPPSFLMDPLVEQLCVDIVSQAKKKLSMNHGTVRLEKGWGPGDGRPVNELKTAVDLMMQEYLLSSDLAEASRCVRELKVPHFHHEVVKRGITNAMEGGKDACDKMSELLKYLIEQEVVSKEQLANGFTRVEACLSDLSLDVPAASTFFTELASRARSDGILSS